MSTTTTIQASAARTDRIGPVARRLRENVENPQPYVDWRAPRFASVADKTGTGSVARDELIDLRD